MRYVLLLSVLLAGCVTAPEDRSAELDRRFGTTCKGLGFEKGTQAYGDCVLKMHAANQSGVRRY